MALYMAELLPMSPQASTTASPLYWWYSPVLESLAIRPVTSVPSSLCTRRTPAWPNTNWAPAAFALSWERFTASVMPTEPPNWQVPT